MSGTAAVRRALEVAPWYERLLVNRWLALLLLAPLLLLIGMTTLQYQRIEANERAGKGPAGSMLIADEAVANKRVLNDYDDFYIVGRLYREGDIIAAYRNDYLLAQQQRFTGAQTFMPWAYPPQITAAVPLLPLAGMGWSYLIVMAATLFCYMALLTCLDRRHAGAAMLAIYPALILNARLGQNGFLTGALIGGFLIALRARKSVAGVPLGLMVIKPHMGVAIGLLALLQRQWRVLGIAVAVVVVTSAAATVVLGPQVWPAFLGGVQSAGGYLQQGLFPLYRMSSVYAGLRSFDLSIGLAMAVHVVAAGAALILLVVAFRRDWPRDWLLALAGLLSLFVSPYNYDYDFACLAFAVCLVLPDLLARIRLSELILFYALAWIGSGSGLIQHFRASLFAGTIDHPHGSSLNWSFQAAGVIGASLLVAFVLRRPAPAGNAARHDLGPPSLA